MGSRHNSNSNLNSKPLLTWRHCMCCWCGANEARRIRNRCAKKTRIAGVSVHKQRKTRTMQRRFGQRLHLHSCAFHHRRGRRCFCPQGIELKFVKPTNFRSFHTNENDQRELPKQQTHSQIEAFEIPNQSLTNASRSQYFNERTRFTTQRQTCKLERRVR